jgi:hypothetical protein
MDDALITALGKLTLGTAGWAMAWLQYSENKVLREKVLGLTERLATLIEGFRGDIVNLKDAVKESK